MTDQSTFLWEEPPANPSASQDLEKDWLTRGVTWPSTFLKFLTFFAPVGWFGRTSPVSCRLTEEGLLEPSLEGFQNSGMGGPTEYLTLSTLEYPSDAVVCSLSDILETGDVPSKYSLSAKACRGILRRGEKRGKTLPRQLQEILTEITKAEKGC